jgi:hypothetical protein
MPATTKNQDKARKGDDIFTSPEVVSKFWDKFRLTHPADFERHGKDSLAWFRKEVSKNFNPKATDILSRPESYNAFEPRATQGMIGKLYLYEYEAEQAGDAELQVYDRFPMVFFFNSGRSKEGKLLLWGLNMHYLAPAQRAAMYEKLMKFKAAKGWSAQVKLKLQWALIKEAAGVLAERAVHAYRVDRFKSRLVEIPSADWIIAVFLQVQKWKHIEGHKTARQSDTRKNIYAKAKPAPKRRRRV